MYFIVESGSTKSDWVLLESKSKKNIYSTIGFNPYFHSSTQIENEIRKNVALTEIAPFIKGIYFYGAGCSSEHLNKIVSTGLRSVFNDAEIIVDHDLLACAYATYTGKPVISCILGTGSNSCYFDGKNLKEKVPALGYILGDEGSGSYFGKQLIANYLYHRLPKELSNDFYATYHLEKDLLIDRIYKQPNANVFIASFMPFIAKHKDHEYIQQMVREGFKKFMDIHVCCFENYKEVEVNFVGSISEIFEKQLQEAASVFGINIGRIIRRPVDSLVQYHLDYVLNLELS